MTMRCVLCVERRFHDVHVMYDPRRETLAKVVRAADAPKGPHVETAGDWVYVFRPLTLLERTRRRLTRG